MDNKTYTLEIIGQNGSQTVKNLTVNGTNYVSETKVDTEGWPAVFHLTAKDGEGTVVEEYPHAKLLQQESYDWDGGKWYLAFAPVSEQEIKNNEFKSSLQYLAMMADVDIDM